MSNEVDNLQIDDIVKSSHTAQRDVVRLMWIAVGFAMLFTLIGTILVLTVNMDQQSITFNRFILFFLICPTIVIGSLLIVARKRRNSIVRVLLKSQDFAALPSIVSAYEDSPQKGLAEEARSTITDLVRQVNESNSRLLTDSVRSSLLRQLLVYTSVSGLVIENGKLNASQLARYSTNATGMPEMQLAIVEMFGRIGDERELQAVERISKRNSPPTHIKLLQAAAEIAVEQIRDRVERRRVGEKLLRASSYDNDESLALLRSAGNSPIEEKLLLIPIQQNQDELYPIED